MIYESELYHHGIKGQKWGKQNGPPYPLERSQKKYNKSIKKYNRVEKQVTRAENRQNKKVSKYMNRSQKRVSLKSMRLSDLNKVDRAVVNYNRKIRRLNNTELKMREQLGEDFVSLYLQEIVYKQ